MEEDRARFGFREVSRAEHAGLVGRVFDSVADRYDLMNDLMSGGLHRFWKSVLVDRADPRAGRRLIDVAGGTGDVASAFMARGGEAVLCDVNERMLRTGADRRLDRGVLHGPPRVCGDARALPLGDRCADVCTISFGLRNVAGRTDALSETRRVLVVGGHFLCLEFSPSVLPLLKPLYDAYSFGALPRLGGLVAGDRDAYRYLAESVRAFPGPERLAAELRDAGFGNVTHMPLSGGIVRIHSAWRVT